MSVPFAGIVGLFVGIVLIFFVGWLLSDFQSASFEGVSVWCDRAYGAGNWTFHQTSEGMGSVYKCEKSKK